MIELRQLGGLAQQAANFGRCHAPETPCGGLCRERRAALFVVWLKHTELNQWVACESGQ